MAPPVAAMVMMPITVAMIMIMAVSAGCVILAHICSLIKLQHKITHDSLHIMCVLIK